MAETKTTTSQFYGLAYRHIISFVIFEKIPKTEKEAFILCVFVLSLILSLDICFSFNTIFFFAIFFSFVVCLAISKINFNSTICLYSKPRFEKNTYGIFVLTLFVLKMLFHLRATGAQLYEWNRRQNNVLIHGAFMRHLFFHSDSINWLLSKVN